MNGFPSVEFDGNDNLYSDISNGVSQPFTAFVVLSFNTLSEHQNFISNNSSDLGAFMIWGTVASEPFNLWTNFGTGIQLEDNEFENPLMTNTAYITTFVIDGPNCYIRVNGFESGQKDCGTDPLSDLIVGKRYGDTRYLHGHISNIIFFDRRLSNIEVVDVENTLRSEWSVDNTHWN